MRGRTKGERGGKEAESKNEEEMESRGIRDGEEEGGRREGVKGAKSGS